MKPFGKYLLVAGLCFCPLLLADQVTAADSENLKAFDSLLERSGPKKPAARLAPKQAVIDESTRLQSSQSDKDNDVGKNQNKRGLLKRRLFQPLRRFKKN